MCVCAYVNISHIASDQSQVHSARKQVREELRGGGGVVEEGGVTGECERDDGEEGARGREGREGGGKEGEREEGR